MTAAGLSRARFKICRRRSRLFVIVWYYELAQEYHSVTTKSCIATLQIHNPQKTLPHRHRLSDRATATKKRRKQIRPAPNHLRYSFYRIESSDRRRFEVTEIRMSQSQIVKIAKLRLKIYFLRSYFRDFDSLFSNRHPQADKSSTPPPVKRPSHRNEKRRKKSVFLKWRWR